MKAIALKLVGVILTIIANVIWFMVAVVAAKLIIGMVVQVASILFAMIRPITHPVEERINARRQTAMADSMDESAKWFAEYTAIMKKEKEVTDAA